MGKDSEFDEKIWISEENGADWEIIETCHKSHKLALIIDGPALRAGQ